MAAHTLPSDLASGEEYCRGGKILKTLKKNNSTCNALWPYRPEDHGSDMWLAIAQRSSCGVWSSLPPLCEKYFYCEDKTHPQLPSTWLVQYTQNHLLCLTSSQPANQGPAERTRVTRALANTDSVCTLRLNNQGRHGSAGTPGAAAEARAEFFLLQLRNLFPF